MLRQHPINTFQSQLHLTILQLAQSYQRSNKKKLMQSIKVAAILFSLKDDECNRQEQGGSNDSVRCCIMQPFLSQHLVIA